GESATFRLYYGASASEQGALQALADVRAEAYALVEPQGAGGKDFGLPQTFVLGLAGVGGDPVFCPTGCDDGNLCTGDRCSPPDGCAHATNALVPDDPCTVAGLKGACAVGGTACREGNLICGQKVFSPATPVVHLQPPAVAGKTVRVPFPITF